MHAHTHTCCATRTNVCARKRIPVETNRNLVVLHKHSATLFVEVIFQFVLSDRHCV